MKPTPCFILLGTLSLLTGSALYIFFRQDSYIHLLAASLLPLPEAAFCGNDFLLYYLPDGLWALSLGCFLSAIVFRKDRKHLLFVAPTVALFGIIWELLQATPLLTGTADLIDGCMYVMAALTVVGINYLCKEKDV